MKREFLMIGAALWAASASGAETGHCDSKPFTLKKPVATPPKAAPAPTATAAPATKSAPTQLATLKTAKADKSKYAIGCKQPKG